MARATQTLSLMAWPPHLSRWQLCAPLKAAATPVAPIATSCPPLSLRYLNEFVGKLQCAPALLDHELFPDAKEITESMALFNAVRRYVVSNNSPTWHDNGKRNGIIVVGDGTTPRTAALFAYRMPTWTSYSVDPALEKKETSKRAQGWSSISNLVVIRNKIENVRIQVNRAVLVLVHAHVTLEQALSAVDADDVVGVVTLPCCNWYGQQEVLFNRGPDLVYDDFSILSDHREVGGGGEGKMLLN
ncbi:hypothetical protein PsorP6_002993 [Peronosclerospora sorghi]|uniref:Uncharacterized protein n=1 Tax=Peronosclerospora sorghi TaxID=230839 RepID=A0ACC0VPW7_9STRA|nr:hypothetical protein PsorP6_002993 [Peronosclerospora sorghi]